MNFATSGLCWWQLNGTFQLLVCVDDNWMNFATSGLCWWQLNGTFQLLVCVDDNWMELCNFWSVLMTTERDFPASGLCWPPHLNSFPFISCVVLIARPEESYRRWRVCDREVSITRGPWPTRACNSTERKTVPYCLFVWNMQS